MPRPRRSGGGLGHDAADLVQHDRGVLSGPPGERAGKPRATYDLREALRDPKLPALRPDPSQLVTLPAFRDLPPATGQFPVVLFSHAYGAVPLQSSTLEIDIAAWGFVVIAPDHRKRDTLAVAQGKASVDDARDALELRSAMGVVAADPRMGAILDTSHVAAVGHARGGATALAALSLADVDTSVAWASVAPDAVYATGAGKPVMLVGAQRDLEDGSEVQNEIYTGLTGPKRLVLLGGGAGHATFVDECVTLRDSGLLPPSGGGATGDRLADLAQNGCHPDELDPLLAWPVIVHFTVAHLRDVFGLDPSPVGLARRDRLGVSEGAAHLRARTVGSALIGRAAAPRTTRRGRSRGGGRRSPPPDRY